jgi:hypothetical protein
MVPRKNERDGAAIVWPGSAALTDQPGHVFFSPRASASRKERYRVRFKSSPVGWAQVARGWMCCRLSSPSARSLRLAIVDIDRDPLTVNTSRIGPFALKERLGNSGSGSVCRAVHVQQHRSVARKVFPARLVAKSPAARAILVRVIETLKRLQHPHIARPSEDRSCEFARFKYTG